MLQRKLVACLMRFLKVSETKTPPVFKRQDRPEEYDKHIEEGLNVPVYRGNTTGPQE